MQIKPTILFTLCAGLMVNANRYVKVTIPEGTTLQPKDYDSQRGSARVNFLFQSANIEDKTTATYSLDIPNQEGKSKFSCTITARSTLGNEATEKWKIDETGKPSAEEGGSGNALVECSPI